MEEIWEDIKNYEGLYQASNLGRIRSRYKYNSRSNNNANLSDKYKMIKPIQISRTNNYLKVSLVKNKKAKQIRVHKIIAETFIDNPYNKLEINHKDGNKHNNKVDNLEWCTTKENIRHAYKNNLMKHKKIKMTNPISNEIKIFNNRFEISTYLNRKVYQDLITRCCNKQRKTAYKMIWEYIS